MEQWKNELSEQRDKLTEEIDSIKYQVELISQKIKVARLAKTKIDEPFWDYFESRIIDPLMDEMKKLNEQVDKIHDNKINIQMLDGLISTIEKEN